MTPTQIARRSDALYADGTCGMTRRVLCDMVAQREADLEDARAECVKLREQVSEACKQLGGAWVECAELRELVRDWHVLAVGGADSLTDWNHAQADLEQRMDALGIEVDE